jgi:acylphosphatase
VASYRYIVSGRVQGVGFRYFALREAESLGLVGFVRNLPDGSVEVVAEGDEPPLARFEERLREGPGFARVSGIDRIAVPPRGGSGFHIR